MGVLDPHSPRVPVPVPLCVTAWCRRCGTGRLHTGPVSRPTKCLLVLPESGQWLRLNVTFERQVTAFALVGPGPAGSGYMIPAIAWHQADHSPGYWASTAVT